MVEKFQLPSKNTEQKSSILPLCTFKALVLNVAYILKPIYHNGNRPTYSSEIPVFDFHSEKPIFKNELDCISLSEVELHNMSYFAHLMGPEDPPGSLTSESRVGSMYE